MDQLVVVAMAFSINRMDFHAYLVEATMDAASLVHSVLNLLMDLFAVGLVHHSNLMTAFSFLSLCLGCTHQPNYLLDRHKFSHRVHAERVERDAMLNSILFCMSNIRS